MDDVATIIRNRRKYALIGCGAVAFIAVILAFGNSTSNSLFVGVFAVLVPFLLVFMINIVNYPAPHAYYRYVNKLLYLYPEKITLFTAIVNAIKKLRKTNMISMAGPQISPAQQIEHYFTAQEANYRPTIGKMPPSV